MKRIFVFKVLKKKSFIKIIKKLLFDNCNQLLINLISIKIRNEKIRHSFGNSTMQNNSTSKSSEKRKRLKSSYIFESNFLFDKLIMQNIRILVQKNA